jgi:hypothetical protein
VATTTAGGAVSAGLALGGRPRLLGVVVGRAPLSDLPGEAGVPGADLGDFGDFGDFAAERGDL